MIMNNEKKKLLSILALTLFLTFIIESFKQPSKTGRITTIIRSLRVESYRWKDAKMANVEEPKVPKILHSIVLGHSKRPMLELVNFTGHMAKLYGFEAMVWTEEFADTLIKAEEEENGFKGLMQTWEYIKQDTSPAKYARMADFLRIVIMWVHGGVYLDADMIVCEDISFMADSPGVVSFPSHPTFTLEVNQSIMSAPPHHRLMGLALEEIISEGPNVLTYKVLYATGPEALARATDRYFKEIGLKLPPLKDKPYRESFGEKRASFWNLQIGDVRFANSPTQRGLHHAALRSWASDNAMKSECFRRPELISPYLQSFCELPTGRRHDFLEGCGDVNR